MSRKSLILLRKGGTGVDNIFFDPRTLKYLGEGAIVGKTVRIRHPQHCIIGDGAIIDDFAYISAHVEIGRHCHIGSHAAISGGERRFVLGEYSTMSSHCSVHCASSEYTAVSLDLPSAPPAEKFGGEIGEVIIGRYVTIGAHSCILPGARLPDGSAFGAYSLIKADDYQSLGLYAGIPVTFRGWRTVPDRAPQFLQQLSKVIRKDA
jgi:acetyltransferase-like isoleucine patch superfamily enzyme